jgi:hypothetical protein
VKSHQKLFMGFSDNDCINVAIWSATNLVIQRSGILTDFAEYPTCSATRGMVLRAVTGHLAVRPLLFGRRRLSTGERSAISNDEGFAGITRLAVAQAHRRTSSEVSSHFSIFVGPRSGPAGGTHPLLRNLGERPSPETVDGILMDYENAGRLEVAGMLVGRPMRYSSQEGRARRVLLERTSLYAFPIVSGMVFGHRSSSRSSWLPCTNRHYCRSGCRIDAAVA